MKGEGRLWFFCEQKKQQKKRNSQAVQKIEKVSKNKEFFFEKKNQKTFAPLCEVVARPLAKNYQSFFASFCSQKEVLSFLLLFKIIFSFVRLGSYFFFKKKKFFPYFTSSVASSAQRSQSRQAPLINRYAGENPSSLNPTLCTKAIEAAFSGWILASSRCRPSSVNA